jgi:uncharacterized protein (TIGR03083 family)
MTLDLVRAAITDAATRAAAVVRGARASSIPVPGLEWTVGETAAHLVVETREYAALLRGGPDAAHQPAATPEPLGPASRSAALNARQLQDYPERELGPLADAIESAAESFVGAASCRPPEDRLQVTNGLTMSVPTMCKVILGECLVHGFDMARATGQPLRLPRSDALAVIDGVMTLVPEYLDPRTAGAVRATYELRFRGGPRYRLAIDHGHGEIAAAGGPVDCTILADPVAFLLVGYRRASQWSQIARGRMLAFGRKPWLAARFGSLLTSV